MPDKKALNKDAEEDRKKNPKKVDKQTKQIAESSDDENPRPELARDRQPKPKKSAKPDK
jgi:hypothetical protein